MTVGEHTGNAKLTDTPYREIAPYREIDACFVLNETVPLRNNVPVRRWPKWPIGVCLVVGVIGMTTMASPTKVDKPVQTLGGIVESYPQPQRVQKTVDQKPEPELPIVSVTDLRFRVEPTRQVLISARRMGVIRYRSAIGSRVENGQVVVQLNDSTAQAELELAEHDATSELDEQLSELASRLAKKKLSAATKSESAGRTKGLKNVVSKVQMAELSIQADYAVLSVNKSVHDRQRFQLEVARLASIVDSYKCVSPFSGVVTEVFHDEGETVQEGQAILQVTDVDNLRAVGFMDCKQVPNVGDKLSFLVDGESVDGIVSYVAYRIEPITQQVEVWVNLPNGRFREGQTAVLQTGGM